MLPGLLLLPRDPWPEGGCKGPLAGGGAQVRPALITIAPRDASSSSSKPTNAPAGHAAAAAAPGPGGSQGVTPVLVAPVFLLLLLMCWPLPEVDGGLHAQFTTQVRGGGEKGLC